MAKTAIVFGYNKFYVLSIVVIGSFLSGSINIYFGSIVHRMLKNQENTEFLVSKIQKFFILIAFTCFFLKTMPFLLFLVGFGGFKRIMTIIFFCIFYVLYP